MAVNAPGVVGTALRNHIQHWSCEPLEPRLALSGAALSDYPNVSSPVVADFDLDGYPDIAAAGTREVVFFRNDGTGNFEEPRVLTLLGRVGTLRLGDVDGDGHQDLVTSYNFSQSFPQQITFSVIRLIRFDPVSGGFTLSSAERHERTVVPVLSADLDPTPGDEVVFRDGNQFLISVFDADASAFSTLQAFDLPPWSTVAFSAGDVDGDGDAELIAGHADISSPVTTLIAYHRAPAHEPPSFAPVTLGMLPGMNGLVPFVTDIDGDGDLDITATYRGPHAADIPFGGFPAVHFIVFTNDGTGSFDEARVMRTVTTGSPRGITGRIRTDWPATVAGSDLIVETRHGVSSQVVRLFRISADGAGGFTSMRIARSLNFYVSIAYIGDLAGAGPADPFDFVLATSGRLWSQVNTPAGEPPTVFFPYIFPAAASYATGSEVRVVTQLFDPRTFLQPNPFRTRVQVFVDINGNGEIDGEDLLAAQRRVNATRNAFPELTFRVTDSMPRGTFNLLVRATGVPGELVGNTFCIDTPVTFV